MPEKSKDICIASTNKDGYPIWSLFKKQFYPSYKFLKLKFDVGPDSG